MATYKKRGGKTRKPRITDADDAQNIHYDGESTTQEVFDSLDETANKSEQWLEKNQKVITYILGIALLAVLAYMLYGRFIQSPKEITSADALAFSKQKYFDALNATDNVDSLYHIALDGVDGKYGLVEVAKKFNGTDAGNMASYMAGMAYSNLDDYQNTIDYLNKFSSDDLVLSALAKGKIADAFTDLNQPKDAFTYYKEAATIRTNDVTTPMYLLKAGNVAMEIGKFDVALTLFATIKEDFSKSDEAKDIDFFINRAKHATR